MESTNQGFDDEGKWVVEEGEPSFNEAKNESVGDESYTNEAHEIVESSAKKEVDGCEEDEVLEPYVGMQFESAEAAKSFYNNYALRTGFRVRIGRSERARRVGEIISRSFYCNKEGFRERRHIERKNRILPIKPSTREGCKAMMMIKKRTEKWVLTRFEKNHNHPLMSPHKPSFLQSFLQSRKHVPGTPRNLMTNVGFSITDAYNCLSTVRQKALEKGDTEFVLHYFKRMQADDPAFFYAIQVDAEERMTNFFWIDGRSRMSYKYFGDVISFDSTYRKNRYQMPFALFTGVNHHQQPVLFGCALLLDETEASYVWLFKTWLVAVYGRHPTSIITYDDAVIANAISQVFTESRHRLCMWHIESEVLDKLDHVYNTYDTFKNDFDKCINLTETVDEFESSWRELIDKYDLGNNDWLQSLYEIRDKWIPAFLRDTFLAGMSTTQKSESMNSYFDWYADVNTSLQDFIILYDKALDFAYSKECEEESRTFNIKPTRNTSLVMEEQMAEIYTKTMFTEFQKELCASLRYIAIIANDDGEIENYRVAKFGEEKSHTVAFNASETRVTCSCQMFEFMGILCRHVHTVLRLKNILLLPSHYILDRWTRNAKCGALYDDCGTEIQANCQESRTLWYNDLCCQAIEYAAEGATSSGTYKVASSALRRSFVKVRGEKQRIAPMSTSFKAGLLRKKLRQAENSQITFGVILDA